MENNQGKKPLRQAANAAKDIYNTYVKNSDKNIPIESDEDKIDELEEKISAAFADDEVSENDELENEAEDTQSESKNINDEKSNNENHLNDVAYLKDHLARKTAEMENMRRRMEKEKQDLVKYANEKLLSSFLEIPDTIIQALNASKNSTDIDSIIKGIELIHQKTLKLFENAGVKKMEDAKGLEFDVNYHDALMQSPSEDIPEGYIVQVLQDGYLLGDKVLRHAKVITSSGN